MSNYDSLAIVGVSRNPEKPSHQLLKKYLEEQKQVFAVNPNADSHIHVNVNGRITEHTSYESLDDIPQKTDAVALYIPRKKFLIDASLRSSLRSRRYGTIIFPPHANPEDAEKEDHVERAINVFLEEKGYVLGEDLLFDVCLLTGRGL